MAEGITPGPTLADAKGPARIRFLEKGIADIDEQITILMDKRYCMQHEIEEVQDRVPSPRELKEQYYEQIEERFKRCGIMQKECKIVLNFCNSRCPNFFHNYEDQESIWCGKLERKLYDAGPCDDLIFDFTQRKIPDCCPLEDFNP